MEEGGWRERGGGERGEREEEEFEGERREKGGGGEGETERGEEEGRGGTRSR